MQGSLCWGRSRKRWKSQWVELETQQWGQTTQSPAQRVDFPSLALTGISGTGKPKSSSVSAVGNWKRGCLVNISFRKLDDRPSTPRSGDNILFFFFLFLICKNLHSQFRDKNLVLSEVDTISYIILTPPPPALSPHVKWKINARMKAESDTQSVSRV